MPKLLFTYMYLVKLKKIYDYFLYSSAKRVPKDIEVSDYLDRNRDFLEAYIIDSVPINQLERWLIKKMTHDPVR